MNSYRKHVLLAEDDQLTRMAFAELIESAGYAVTSVSNGRDALNKLVAFTENNSSELVLLVTDMKMPYLSGVDLLEQMKALDIRIPVLAITAYGDKKTVVRLMRSGCRDYLEKPVDANVLLDAVDRIFGKMIDEKEDAEKHREENRKAQSYLVNLEKIQHEVNTAVQSYKNLMNIKEAGYKVRAACYNRPLFPIGGDFADIADTAKGCQAIIADVSGHDMGASFHTVLVKSLFNENQQAPCSGETFLSRLNQHLVSYSKTERIVTALFLNIDLENRVCEAVSAGHPPYILMKKNQAAETGAGLSGDVLGIFETVHFNSHSFPIESGDRIFLYTDGVINAGRFVEPAGRTEKLSGNGLERLIRQYANFGIHATIARIGDSIIRYCGYVLDDDILLLGLEIP